jgi:hypothetical protein
MNSFTSAVHISPSDCQAVTDLPIKKISGCFGENVFAQTTNLEALLFPYIYKLVRSIKCLKFNIKDYIKPVALDGPYYSFKR